MFWIIIGIITIAIIILVVFVKIPKRKCSICENDYIERNKKFSYSICPSCIKNLFEYNPNFNTIQTHNKDKPKIEKRVISSRECNYICKYSRESMYHDYHCKKINKYFYSGNCPCDGKYFKAR